MKAADLRSTLTRARARRGALWDSPHTNAFRVVNGEGDRLPDVTVDWFDQVAVLSLYREHSVDEEQALLDALETVLSPKAIYLKRRPREARVVANTQKAELAPELAARGQPVPQLEVREAGLRYWIRPGQGLSVGLYLDMREGRDWVRKQAQGRTVLNCFAYTCGFGVAALAGGAQRAVNLDLSRRVLDWGAENTQLNGFPVDPRDFLAGEVFEWLRRLHKRGERFDLLILDPPSFSTSKEGRFSAGKDYARLVAQAAPLISPGGILLACCNLATLSATRFALQVREGLVSAQRRPAIRAELTASAVDFPEPDALPSPLKVLAVDVG